MAETKKGIVYVLENPAMPGLVKIGQTGNEIGNRLKELNTTGVPFPFDCLYACEVSDREQVEVALHEAFRPYRVNPKREFFKINPEQAIVILRLLENGRGNDITSAVSAEIEKTVSAEERNASEAYKKRRPPLNFAEMGIPIGARLVFTYKDMSGEAFVSSERKVRLHDGAEEKSLTQVTREILQVDYNIQPTGYWSYEGKSLSDYYEQTYGAAD
ncbi:MAG: GIY-YIG nuclease family protein [Treponema sp.]|nr:GIY-YIG nuclease family protein [Treponema sp.]